MALVDMKRSGTDPESGCDCMPSPCDSDDQYPYGLNCSLGTQELAKLGISQMPAVGSEIKGQFVGVVTACRQGLNDNDDTNLSFQIVQLEAKIEAQPEAKQTTPAASGPGMRLVPKRPASIVS